MPEYSFEVLNDKDLEKLVRDLLQAELGIYFESFKSGKDDGIDLRHSKAVDNNSSVIAQVKHWQGTGIRPLIRHLEMKELPKVRRLDPKRYILATSVGLSPRNKADIAAILHPYVKDTSDIFGRDDLNNLLSRHTDIETKHYKLWISSTTILQRILNNAVTSRSAFVQSEIIRKASLFVPTASLPVAIEILNKHHVLLIKGVPGVGKTSLADFLTYRLLADGFKLVVVEDLRDAEDAYHPTDRQVFYFDDFLGSNYLQLVQAKGSGADISRFADRIAADKKKRLILTTRTTILNRAYQQLHLLDGVALKPNDFELQLDDYSRFDRARILYNHMYFRGLPQEFSDQLFENEQYFDIIDHENYNPRIIEFITDPRRLESIESKDYIQFIQQNLDQPEAIWKSAYETQIDDDARFALDTLFSLGDSANSKDLQKAFDSRLDYEVANNGFRRNVNAFHNAMRLLLGGFVVHKASEPSQGTYSFVNPAVIDFLISRFSHDLSEKWRVLDSSTFLSQLDTRFGTTADYPIGIEEHEQARFFKLLESKVARALASDSNRRKLLLLNLIAKSFEWSIAGSICERLLDSVALESISNSDLSQVHLTIRTLIRHSDGAETIQNKADPLIRGLLTAASVPEEIGALKRLLDDASIDYATWISKSVNKSFAQEAIDKVWLYGFEEFVLNDSEVQSIYEEDDAEGAIYQLLEKAEGLNSELGVDSSPAFDEIREFDLEDVIQNNIQAAQAEDHLTDMHRERLQESGSSDAALIRDLFSR